MLKGGRRRALVVVKRLGLVQGMGIWEILKKTFDLKYKRPLVNSVPLVQDRGTKKKRERFEVQTPHRSSAG